jgi:hypothetical protein
VNSEDKTAELDRVLSILSRPLSRYILSVLAGVDPGTFAEPLEIENETLIDHTDKNQ